MNRLLGKYINSTSSLLISLADFYSTRTDCIILPKKICVLYFQTLFYTTRRARLYKKAPENTHIFLGKIIHFPLWGKTPCGLNKSLPLNIQGVFFGWILYNGRAAGGWQQPAAASSRAAAGGHCIYFRWIPQGRVRGRGRACQAVNLDRSLIVLILRRNYTIV